MVKSEEKWKAKKARKAARHAAKYEGRKSRRKAKAVLSRNEMADQLRALAAQVEKGAFSLGEMSVDLPSRAGFEIGYRVKPKGGHRIEVKIGWGGAAASDLLPTV